MVVNLRDAQRWAKENPGANEREFRLAAAQALRFRRAIVEAVPPDIRLSGDAMRALRDGDEEGFVRALGGFGIEPDTIFESALEACLIQSEEARRAGEVEKNVVGYQAPLIGNLTFLRYHRRRQRHRPEEWYEELGRKVYRALKIGYSERLMRSLEGFGANFDGRGPEARADEARRHRALRDQLPGVIPEAEAEGYVLASEAKGMLYAVEKRIIEANRPQSQKGRPAVAYDPFGELTEVPRAEEFEGLPESMRDDPDAHTTLERALKRALIVMLMERARLTPEEREVYELYLQGCTSKKMIAALLDITPEAARKRFSRANAKLRAVG